MPPKEKYTDPKLRDEVKEEIHNGDKGGAPGQWSARKAQMMAAEYKKRGGGYNTDKSEQDESQKHLSEWTEEEWQTKEGSGSAKKDDGTEKRYLPKKAWEQMSEKEKEETDEKKLEGSKEGKQHVGNTKKAKESRKKAHEEEQQEDGKEDDDDDDEVEQEEVDEDVESDGEEEYEYEEADEEEIEDDDDGDAEDREDGEEAKADGKKRTRGQQNGSNKSQKANSGKGQSKSNGSKSSSNGHSKEEETNKSSSNVNKKGTVGSKHMKDEDPAPKGSADRLPKKGQAAQWKALPGFVKGKVEDILTEAQEVDGKNVKASEKDPRIVLKSDSSGKICVHKPEACYYE
ncbi:hypothetical protein Q7P35_007108 [Cladosporium inversicolor]